MFYFNDKRTFKEQMDSGRLTFSTTLKLTRLAYQVSTRKLQQFYLPSLCLVILVLAISKLLHIKGSAPMDYVSISMGLFAFYSWFAVRFFWSNIAIDFLGWVQFMFGPKTRNAVIERFLDGKGFDLVQTSKLVGEHADSQYAKMKADQQ